MADETPPHSPLSYSSAGSDTDSAASTEPPSERHPTLYYDDGTVVLSGLTQGGSRQYFKVHKSVLCQHSPLIADVFAIPPLLAPGSETCIAETYDGVVHIQMPDTAEELVSFLTMFYDPL